MHLSLKIKIGVRVRVSVSVSVRVRVRSSESFATKTPVTCDAHKTWGDAHNTCTEGGFIGEGRGGFIGEGRALAYASPYKICRASNIASG